MSLTPVSHVYKDLQIADGEIVKLHIQPTVVLLSSRADDALYENMDPEHRSRDSANEEGS